MSPPRGWGLTPGGFTAPRALTGRGVGMSPGDLVKKLCAFSDLHMQRGIYLISTNLISRESDRRGSLKKFEDHTPIGDRGYVAASKI